jgi:hypothetical protein
VKAVEPEREEEGDHDLRDRSALKVDDETDESKLPQPVQTGRRIVGMQTSDAAWRKVIDAVRMSSLHIK